VCHFACWQACRRLVVCPSFSSIVEDYWIPAPAFARAGCGNDEVERSSNTRLKRPASGGPFERFREYCVEVLNELDEPLMKFFCRSKTRPFQESPSQYGKPDLHLIEPRAVPWRRDESNSVRCILQKTPPARHRLQYATSTFDTKIIIDATAN
jgi:hypothetical protein